MDDGGSVDRIDGAVVALLRRIARGAAQGFVSTPSRVRSCRTRRLEERAVRLLETLPPELRMVALRGQYPRLLNRLAAAWHDPREFDRLIDELLIDDRPNRQGFPFEVVRELTELREYYFAMVRPEARRGPGSGPIRGFR
jgi:hypothetical protein